MVAPLLISLTWAAAPIESGHAQTTTAGIRGIVRDSAGSPLGGAEVEVIDRATGRRFSTTADGTGRFRFIQLPIGGPYAIIARRIGYRPVEETGIYLALGDLRGMTLVLNPSVTELAPVEVVAAVLGVRADRVGGSTAVDSTQLAVIPVKNRDFADLASLSPLTGPQLSLAGMRWTSTEYRIDGLEARNQLRAGSYNAGPFAVPQEAIRTFEVNTNLYDVTMGRQGGGEVAALTKSGTNQWRAAAFGFYRSDWLGSEFDYQQRPREVRPFTTAQYGFSAGGPLVKDQAHLFVAFERQDGSNPLLVGQLDTPEAENAAGIAADSLDRILTILTQQYGTDSTVEQVGKLPRSPAANSIFARLDWALSQRNLLTLRHAASHWSDPLSGGVDQPIALLEARSDFSSDEQQFVAALRSTFSRATQNELRLGVSHSSRLLVPQSPGVPRGFVQTRSTLPDGTTGNATVQFGGNRLAPDQSREWQLQLVDHLFVQRGDLVWTAGFDNSLTRLTTLIGEAQSGLFVFPSIAALEAELPNRFTRTVPLDGPSPQTELTVLNASAFVQGEWRPSSKLVLSAGLRWDGSGELSTPPYQPLVDSALGVRTDRPATDWFTLSPRAQVLWDVNGDGRDLFRLGAGLFTASPPSYAFHNQMLYTGRTLADIDQRGTAVPAPDYPAYRDDPSTVPGVPAGAAPLPYVNVLGASFQLPTTWKGSVSYRRAFAPWIRATISLMGARGSSGYHYEDLNLRAQPAFTLANEGSRGVYVPASTIPATSGLTDVRNAIADPRLARVVALESNGESRQYGASLEVSMNSFRVPRELTVAYAWGHARDNSTYGCCLARTATTFTAITTDPRDLAFSWGPSDFDIRHRIVIAGTTPIVWGISVSGRLIAQSGRPYSLVVDGDLNGDESNSNDLAFLFDPDNPDTDPAVAQSFRNILANPDNLARDYIASHLGRVSVRNELSTPWSAKLDLRLIKQFWRQPRLLVMADLYNVLNLIDSDWGAERVFPQGISSQNPVVNRLPLLRITGFDPTRQLFRYTVNEQIGVLPKGGDPYQIQFGLRVEW